MSAGCADSLGKAQRPVDVQIGRSGLTPTRSEGFWTGGVSSKPLVMTFRD